jgi:hypothetical protein
MEQQILCVGCESPLDQRTVAAFAIMHERDLADGELTAHIKGAGRFHAAAVCGDCYTDPSHRKRDLKAHYAMPEDVARMLGRAGSSSIG